MTDIIIIIIIIITIIIHLYRVNFCLGPIYLFYNVGPVFTYLCNSSRASRSADVLSWLLIFLRSSMRTTGKVVLGHPRLPVCVWSK